MIADPSVPVAPAPSPARFDFEAIGTHWQIETPQPLPAATRAAVLMRVEAFDRDYSRFRPDSLVTALARGAASVEFPADAEPLFELYDRLHAATDGAVDPLVGARLEQLGYDANYSLRASPAGESSIPDARARPRWSTTVTRASASPGSGVTVSAPAGTVIDLGAAGKGYLVDLVATVLRDAGHREYVVDGSGDLAHSGGAPVRVGLEHPLDPRKAIGVAEFAGLSLCASASNRRAWGDGLHHIVDPRTGSPAREVIATWVVASSTALADGLATALFFTGAHQLAKTFHFSYVRMYADGRAERSRDFPGELFA
ncbi:FAD:protein FMN transferase [Herbiconiux sp. VKM Ac-1786]|uniref:FAD:protein FMN transferase n=1 Tax=Herbiconiux sp. VKM Ac-1786 TaxID=2783824 RepID=UPI00188BA1A5|nr:FAD:protein FMN transferase [Herbiconiux sp. VKM Ac-1786]MBF4571710.1 FAD:protein FMN transferase [Herbiconiux sp. VKM Ac-1786]